jgi:hypothetical protein
MFGAAHGVSGADLLSMKERDVAHLLKLSPRGVSPRAKDANNNDVTTVNVGGVMRAVNAMSEGVAMSMKQVMIDAVTRAPQPALLCNINGDVLAVNQHALAHNIAAASAQTIADVLIGGASIWASLAGSDERVVHTLPTTTAVLCAWRVRRCAADDADGGSDGALVVLLVEHFGVEVASMHFAAPGSLNSPGDHAVAVAAPTRRVKKKTRSSRRRHTSANDSEDQDSSPSDSSQGQVSESDSIDAVDAPPAALRSRSQQDMHTPFVPTGRLATAAPAAAVAGRANSASLSLTSLASVLPTGWFARLRRGGTSADAASRTKVSLVGDTIEVRHTLAPTVAAVSISGFECAMKSVALPGDAAANAAVAERCAVLPLVAALNKENVMRVVGYNMTSDTQLLVFSELCDKSLAGYLAQQGDAPLSDATLLDFAAQIAVGIRHIHFHSIMHRDINAKHVLIKSVVRDFSAGTPAPAAVPVLKLGSFGAACSISGALGAQQYRASVGDADFMAPEVATGTYDESCDIWSFGALLFVLLAHGRQPRLTLDGERLARGQSLPLPPACSTLLVEVFQKCTSVRPAERPTATQLCTRLGSNLLAFQGNFSNK